jgi:hypothetical protein
VSLVENVKSIGRLRIVVFNTTYVLFVTEVEAAAGLANIFLIACCAR